MLMIIMEIFWKIIYYFFGVTLLSCLYIFILFYFTLLCFTYIYLRNFAVPGSTTPSSGGSSEKVKAKKSGSSKPKRLCPPITLDSAGRPIFPITLGPLTIHSLGEVR